MNDSNARGPGPSSPEEDGGEEAVYPGQTTSALDGSSPVDPLAFHLRALRIIHFALCLGAILFLVIVPFLAPIGAPEVQGPLFAYLDVALAVPLLLVAWLLPSHLDAAQRKRVVGLRGRAVWGVAYHTRFIIRAAQLEGLCFAQMIFYLLAAQSLNLGLALGALVFLMLMFPTRSGIEEWKERQEERMRQENTG